jgi:PAS domain-containing protein
MHASMSELLEHLKPGLIWVGTDGVVRYANRSGSRCTGLATGSRIADRALSRAVIGATIGQVPRQATLPLAASAHGVPGATVGCRVVPGPGGDDAFVFVEAHADDGTGVDTLMRALRQDLRDPLRSAQAALALAQQARARADDTGEIEALLDRVERLLEVADQLVELAALWDEGLPAADDRIELWALMQRAWGEVEPEARARGVRVGFGSDLLARTPVTLYGSERWLRRVFVECLQSAVRGTRAGGEVQVRHLQDGGRAQVTLLAGRHADEAADGSEAVARQLCRHVLLRHGGRLRDEDDGPLRQRVIELPTGAPSQVDDAQLAIAQAQRYARDLSALMIRRRRPAETEPD